MTQMNLFEKKTPAELTNLINDLVRRGGANSYLSKPNLPENITLIENIQKENSQIGLSKEKIRFLGVKHWFSSGGKIDNELAYRIGNLAEDEAVIFALDVVGAHAVGKFGQSIEMRIMNRLTKFIPILLEHPSFQWNEKNALNLMSTILDKGNHSAIKNVLQSEKNVFDYFSKEDDRAIILKKITEYLDNKANSAMLQFNCGRMIDIIYEKEWSLEPIEHLLDDTHWGKELKILVQERWMLENVPGTNNIITKTLKF